MPRAGLHEESDFRAAWLTHEQQDRINTGRVAALLVVVLMPVGMLLDEYYPQARDAGLIGYFLILRLVCSALAGVIWLLLGTSFGQRHYRLLGPPIAWLPAGFICWMIYKTQGAASPYYAGLNLVLLAVSVVVHWNLVESLAAVGGIVLMYAAACFGRDGGIQRADLPIFVNNFYFVAVTGVIVLVGNELFNRLRLREFALRYELDQNRQKLQETNEKLVELDQAKSRFFANISHELRTPLTLLLAPLESMIHRPAQSLDEAQRDLLLTMRSNGMRLLKLINDLLDLVRLESGRMEVKQDRVEVAEFVKGLASAARHVAQDKHIQLETWVDPVIQVVTVDRDKLEKVILNLVFNALKFTPAGGRVELRAEKQENELILAVSDTGMGISEKNLPYVFDRFWQADTSSRRKFQGVGIGLALVKELVELQAGTVSVQSQEGHGTTFTVRLPFIVPSEAPKDPAEPASSSDPAAATAPPATPSEEWLSSLYRRAELFPALTPVKESVRPVESWSNGPRPRILVADDEPDMLRFLKSQLLQYYEVLEAVDGQQAVEKAGHFLPDLVLLDMMMPEKDGLQACRELRENTPTQSIPVILLTARADEETKLAALSAGANDFLPKPFSTTELHVRIKNLVESYDYQRKVAKQNRVLAQTIEQLKETETQLVQSEKMASLGRMSAGIIHEINNPLNFATTCLFSLRGKDQFLVPDQRAEYSDVLKDAEEGLRRVRDIISDLRSFSYAGNEGAEAVPVSEALDTALHLLSHEWKDAVEIYRNLPPDQIIWANRNKIVQVFMNILQNSIDAFKGKTFDHDKPSIRLDGRTEGDRTILVFRDNGTGIAAEHMDKIFDPFFTTKDVGEGMGLGLSICYRILQEYGARVHVKSEPGQFCEFTLDFPRQNPAAPTSAATP